MSALSLRMSESSKNRHFLWDGFPKPSRDRDRSPPSLLFTRPPSRAASPYLSNDVSPLPSPIVPPSRDSGVSPTPFQSASSSPQGSSKTSAFFGSAWASRIPTPAPPPPVQRSNTLHPNTGSTVNRSPNKYGNIVSQNPEDSTASPRAVSDSHSPSRSQTTDFFNGPKMAIPTPPPSIHSITPSPERRSQTLPTPPAIPSSPVIPATSLETDSARLNIPISRFFPGRVAGDAKGRVTDDDVILGFPDALSDPLSRTPSLHRPTTGFEINRPDPSRGDYTIDGGVDGSDLSRSSSRSSVSGFRRDFYVGSSGSSRSLFSGYQPPRPGSYERESDRDGTGWTNSRTEPAEAPGEVPMVMATSPVDAGFLIREDEVTPNGELQQQEPPRALTAHPSPPRPAKPTLRQHPSRPGSSCAVRRETHRSSTAETILEQGAVIGDEVPLELLKPLGQGAFSSVWLARDVEDRLLPPLARSASKKQRQKRRKSASIAMRLEEYVRGIKPSAKVKGLDGTGPGVLDEMDGRGACLPTSSTVTRSNTDTSDKQRRRLGRVVAVKMMDRALCDANDRTRISFVREVEVLRHISHPSIVSYLHSFTTESHHCLVLEQVAGGELFELMNSDENHARMTEPLLRRMWGELCKAVGWMHGVALVHRDIKLENILLTVNPFLAPGPIDLELLPQPLVKLTDFGLARFIDPTNPMLATRCGSESYAAPEIVTGSKYDGRKTDAWACGVVLYALATRTLPFDRKPFSNSSSHGHGSGDGVVESRRSYLVRIAQGVYSWPEPGTSGSRLSTEGVQNVVGRLLVRDPAKRAWIWEVWEEEWMEGEGAVVPPKRVVESRRATETVDEVGEDGEEAVMDDTEVDGLNAEGMLVDQHNIGSVASQELV